MFQILKYVSFSTISVILAYSLNFVWNFSYNAFVNSL